MTPTNEKDSETYRRIYTAVKGAIRKGDRPSVICSVLLKTLISLVITHVKEGEDAMETLSDAINEAFDDLRKNKII